MSAAGPCPHSNSFCNVFLLLLRPSSGGDELNWASWFVMNWASSLPPSFPPSPPSFSCSRFKGVSREKGNKRYAQPIILNKKPRFLFNKLQILLSRSNILWEEATVSGIIIIFLLTTIILFFTLLIKIPKSAYGLAGLTGSDLSLSKK